MHADLMEKWMRHTDKPVHEIAREMHSQAWLDATLGNTGILNRDEHDTVRAQLANLYIQKAKERDGLRHVTRKADALFEHYGATMAMLIGLNLCTGCLAEEIARAVPSVPPEEIIAGMRVRKWRDDSYVHAKHLRERELFARRARREAKRESTEREAQAARQHAGDVATTTEVTA